MNEYFLALTADELLQQAAFLRETLIILRDDDGTAKPQLRDFALLVARRLRTVQQRLAELRIAEEREPIAHG